MPTKLILSDPEVEALVSVLGDVLDGVGNFDGSTLLDLSYVYEALTHSPNCDCGCLTSQMIESVSNKPTTECRCSGCMETEIYGKGMCQECFDQGCDVEENH